MSNQRDFFDAVGKELGVVELVDWYKVRKDDVIARGGRTLFDNFYQDSLLKALQHIYPGHLTPVICHSPCI